MAGAAWRMKKSLRELFDVRAKEVAPTLLMSTYFFLVITCFWILKPLKKSLFLRNYKAAPLELWGMVFDGFRPDRADVVGALVCLVGVGIIMYGR